MLCANVKVSAEIYKKNNAKPPAGIRYTHPRGCVFSFYFKRIITGKAPRLPLGGSWLGSKAAQPEGVTPTAPAGHLPPRGRQVIFTQAGVFVIKWLQKASLRYACLL